MTETITIQCPKCKKYCMHPYYILSYDGSDHPNHPILVKDIEYFQCTSCDYMIIAKNEDYSLGFNEGYRKGKGEK